MKDNFRGMVHVVTVSGFSCFVAACAASAPPTACTERAITSYYGDISVYVFAFPESLLTHVQNTTKSKRYARQCVIQSSLR
jgi:hypothetical protein